MKISYEVRLSNRKKMHLSYTKSLIKVLNELDDTNAYKDTNRYYGLRTKSHWLRGRIDLMHHQIEYLENKIRGEKDVS